MKFDSFTAAILVMNSNAPVLDEAAAAALQDEHLLYLATLHERGHMLAAGPLMGGDDPTFRGLCLFRISADRARKLLESDPAVRAGKFVVEIFPWMVPGEALAYRSARFPKSMADVMGD